MPQSLLPLWISVKQRLNSLGIFRSGSRDCLVWSLPKARLPVRVKDIYAIMISVHDRSFGLLFPPCLWEAGCPLKMIILSWLVFRNRNLTWEVLQRKNWQGPSRCAMCHNAEESNLHMFFQCASSLHIWYDLSLSFGFPYLIFPSVQDGFKWWSEQCLSWRSLFIIAYWFLWKWRNAQIFQESKEPLNSILQRIMACYDSFHRADV